MSCFLSLFIYFEKEREHGQQRAEREGERENPKQAPYCPRRAWCTAQTQERWDRDPRVRCLTNWATQVPTSYWLLTVVLGSEISSLDVFTCNPIDEEMRKETGRWIRWARRSLCYILCGFRDTDALVHGTIFGGGFSGSTVSRALEPVLLTFFFFFPTLITFRTSVSKNTIEMQIVLVSVGLCVLGNPLESEWRKAHRDLVYLLCVWTYWWPQIGNHWVSRHHQQEAQRFICQYQRTEQWKRRATVHLRFIDEQTDEKRTCIFLQSGLMGWGRG